MEDPDLEELSNPDVDGSDASYKWDVDFQRHIISLLLVDTQFLVQSMDLIRPTYFTNKAHQRACNVLFSFFKKYKILPKKSFVFQEVKDFFKDDKAKLAYLSEINALYDYFEPGMESRDYLTDKIVYFAKIQAIKNAFTECMKLIDKNPEHDETWLQVYDKLRVAMNTDRNFEQGLKYFTTMEERYERMIEEDDSQEKFITGWPSVDQSIKGGGYNRGEMISIIAASGVGKSVALSCIAATNAKRGKRCVYISLELSEDRVAERFDSIFTGASIHCLYDQKDEIFEQLAVLVEDKADKNLIVIKQFPGRKASVNTIRAYLTQLKFNKFVPDIVIIDYIGEMANIPDVPVHESREQTVSELRALANEGDKFFCATAMQPNRSAKEAQKSGRIGDEHLADSYGQIRPLDGAIAISQNDAEKSVFLGRGSVMKQRFGKSGFDFYLAFDKEALRITEVSHTDYKGKMASRTEKISDEVAIDKVVKTYKPSDAE